VFGLHDVGLLESGLRVFATPDTHDIVSFMAFPAVDHGIAFVVIFEGLEQEEGQVPRRSCL